MAHSPEDHPQTDEVVFDVTKPTDGITFLGLLDGFDRSSNKLTALFDWRCRACGATNRDAAVVESGQGVLCRWSCSSCAEMTVLRFRARASTEWIAEHTMAVTGDALCHLAEGECSADSARFKDGPRRSGGQRAFAWLAIPGLVVLVLFGLSDMRRFARSSVAPVHKEEVTRGSAALSRLHGVWLSEDGQDRLHVNRVDPVLGTGSYIHVTKGRRADRVMRFVAIYEDPKRGQFVLRQWDESSGAPNSDDVAVMDGWDTALHIRLHGESLTWIDINGDDPIVKVYRRAGTPSIR